MVFCAVCFNGSLFTTTTTIYNIYGKTSVILFQDFTKEPKITVYAGDFRSRSVEFTKDVLDLRWYNMNDQISYLEVHSGA